MHKLNIITPCTRPQNLEKISKSIKIPRENYCWIVVFDSETIPKEIPDNCEAYAIKVKKSAMGNGQRNYALEMIKDGHVYFNDDDTTVHPDLWNQVKNLSADIITFSQANKDGSIRLMGNLIRNNHVDSHNFIVNRKIIGELRWILNRYDADGIFIEECAKQTKDIKFIPKILSIYNALRV